VAMLMHVGMAVLSFISQCSFPGAVEGDGALGGIA